MTMDTDSKYVDGADFYVRMAGEQPPDWVKEYRQERIDDPDDPLVGSSNDPLRDHHQLDEDVPIDGIVQFYFPDVMDDPDEKGVWSFHFPFRDHRKDGQWFVNPGKPWGSRRPVWKWKNPDESRENITLEPSLGVGDPMCFHCFIRGGDVEWL